VTGHRGGGGDFLIVRVVRSRNFFCSPFLFPFLSPDSVIRNLPTSSFKNDLSRFLNERLAMILQIDDTRNLITHAKIPIRKFKNFHTDLI
jgi:hypothetical protein